MKIKSNFKDYYDYVTHTVMGGGDDKVVYVRSRIKELEQDFNKVPMDHPFSVKQPGVLVLPSEYERTAHKPGDIVFQYAWLVVAGRYFPLVRQYTYETLGINHFNDELDGFVAISNTHVKYERFFPSRSSGRWYLNEYRQIDPTKQYPELIELSKTLGHPVFVITETNHNKVVVSRKCPNLGKMGMPYIYQDFQLYQDLYYFLSNVMRENPDVMPAPKPPMTDKEKISSHGFDLKQSFRHRK